MKKYNYILIVINFKVHILDFSANVYKFIINTKYIYSYNLMNIL